MLADTGGRGEAGAMYDQGDQEDRDIANEQRNAAKQREELPDADEEESPSPLGTAVLAGGKHTLLLLGRI